jgi:hypothetical protein
MPWEMQRKTVTGGGVRMGDGEGGFEAWGDEH